ncbi:MAG: response regulator transcription factor [Chromatiales bacterium]|nr:response regulator transcription factor [Chromatiales bacterium]
MNPTRVLVIEDAADIREELVDYLRFQGCDAAGVESVADMRASLEAHTWDVLVLDLGLPDGDGLAVARELRSQRGLQLGIVIVTARGHTEDRIAGLSAGADTYLVKPVNPRELKAVIDQLALRLRETPPESPPDGWRLDEPTLTLHCPGGMSVSLTGTEARILTRLFESRGQPVSRPELCRYLAPSSPQDDTRRLDTLISRLRSKVERETGVALPLNTFRSVGYAFNGRVRD